MNIEYLKKKGFNFLYIISIIFITLVMIRIIILNDLINSISILNEKMEKIEKSEIINDPLKKIRETLEDAANRPLSPEIIEEIKINIDKIYNDSLKPIFND